MGSQYTVHARDGFEVCLKEAGNEFHLMLKATDEADTRHVVAWPNHRTAGAYAKQWLTPDDVVAMAVEMIRVASVWVKDERALLDAAALKVMELGAYAAPREPGDDDEEITGLVAKVAAAAVPLVFPSRPAAPVPAYLHPDYVPRERARLVEMAERAGLGDEVRGMLALGESRA